MTVSGLAGEYNTYALLDDGSTATLIDAEVATHIGAQKSHKESISIHGVGGMCRETEVDYVTFHIRGKYMSETYSVKNARSIQSLCLSSQSIPKTDLMNYSHLVDLAEELSHNYAKPTILIGACDWHLSITRQTRAGKPTDPVATRTLLGWTLHGIASSKTKAVNFINHFFVNTDQNDRLDCLIKEQYKLDSIGISKFVKPNLDDERVINILERTSRRLESGHFEIGLPWRTDSITVPDSYPQALSRLKSLEKSLFRDPAQTLAYKTYINGLVEKGYAEVCTSDTYHSFHMENVPSNSSNIRWYLPHFGVFHPQKKKLRVVHDAAAVTKGVSLNSLLLVGPDLLQSLLGVLFRFREGQFAMTADIREMFPQIKIRESDRDAQRFLWRNCDTDSKVIEYRMSSMIFGAASSPCSALFIKNKNASEMKHKFPEAAETIIRDHYMDDCTCSLDDVHTAAHLARDVITVHKAAGFDIRAWISNDTRVLSFVPKDLWANPDAEVNLLSDVSTLGLKWNPAHDTFGFRTGSFNNAKQLTKRSVLSHVMSVYDPLGLLTPLVIKGRILIQQLWRDGVGWDEILPDKFKSVWHEWISELGTVSNIRVPRWYLSEPNPTDLQLHIFADASEQAYACVAYWRFCYSDGTVKLALIGSKARVAPLKPTSIPRLELQAALIASRLSKTICDMHRIKPSSTFYWTDSTTVLKWLRNDARNFQAFVAHRVGEITEITNVSNWRWLPSALNVADDATRVNASIMNPSNRWFCGPSFLLKSSKEWPVEPTILENAPIPETKSKLLVGFLSQDQTYDPPVPDASRFSAWLRLLRATARVLQAAKKFGSLIRSRLNLNSKLINTNISPNSLTASDIIEAEKKLLLRSQYESFPEEIAALKASKPLNKRSPLAALTPVFDENGLIRINSRIKSAPGVSESVKSLIVLNGRHRIVRLLVRDAHIKAGHAYNELVHNELRQRFWILRCRNVIRSIAYECLKCRRIKTQPKTPPVADLPQERLDHHCRIFTNVGLDYFGPLEVTIGRRKEKRYVALYTCMVSRAVHLEVVGSLSADGAIMSLRRFIARRGSPSKIFSDNGTAFIGASRQLTALYNSKVEDFAANNKISWHFIPPSAPFMGGCWERMVRCVKTALLATLKGNAPKEEVFHTLLLEAEAIVNSRPLTYIAVDPENPEAITPFHFLIGTSSNARWLTSLDDSELYRRCDWRRTLRLADHFWTRWVKEYLPTLMVRGRSEPSLTWREGDIVLIADGTLPRSSWPIGKIIKLFPGHDGIVRVVDVDTKGGILRRPVKKLVHLLTKTQTVATQ